MSDSALPWLSQNLGALTRGRPVRVDVHASTSAITRRGLTRAGRRRPRPTRRVLLALVAMAQTVPVLTRRPRPLGRHRSSMLANCLASAIVERHARRRSPLGVVAVLLASASPAGFDQRRRSWSTDACSRSSRRLRPARSTIGIALLHPADARRRRRRRPLARLRRPAQLFGGRADARWSCLRRWCVAAGRGSPYLAVPPLGPRRPMPSARPRGRPTCRASGSTAPRSRPTRWPGFLAALGGLMLDLQT